MDGTATGAPERRVYLDHAAATPLDPAVLEAMMPYLTDRFCNPSAPYAEARAVRAVYEEARARLAHVMGAKASCVTITAGATEANNIALASAPGSIVTTAVEHESVLAGARERGAVVVGVGCDGRVDPRDVALAITPETGLVSVALANGEVGAVQPVADIGRVVAAERARRLEVGENRPIWLHTDASQAAGSLSIAVSSLVADLVTVSAAKIYGPKQVGLLWAREGVALTPLLLGGGQENGVRSGTEDVAGAVGFAAALELAASRRVEESRRERDLRNGLQRALCERYPWMRVNGPSKDRLRLPGLLSVSFPGVEARRLVVALDRCGVSVGTGSACAASKMRVSPVLQAMGATEEEAAGSIRMSLGRSTAKGDVDYAFEALCRAVDDELAR